jgi:uncharacterized protein (UPF0332 family)
LALDALESARKTIEIEEYNLSVNRSYYAAFYAASALILKKTDKLPRRHQGTINQFSLHYIKTKEMEKKYFEILHKLEQDRSDSDYTVLRNFSKEEAKINIKQAELFIEESKKFL